MSKKELGRLGFEAIEFVIRKFLAKNKEGIATIPGRDMKDKVRLLVDKYAKLFSLKGKDVNKVTVKEVQNEIDYGMALSKQRAKEEALKKFPPETHKFFGRPLTEKDFKEIDKLYPPKKDPFQGFTPKIVPKKPNPLGDILQGKPYIDKQGRSWGFQKVPHPKGPAKIIPFPKKPPGKADGGRIDKALPKRSRDI